MTIYDLLHEVQKKLKAPKKNYNSFAKYNYRSCEDIVEAVKGVLPSGCYLILSDCIELIGDRHYVKATASFGFQGKEISVSAYAREPLEKKGSDASQITGATSSYARKYALNGLFCIDDSVDADVGQQEEEQQPVSPKELEQLQAMVKSAGSDMNKLLQHYNVKALYELDRESYNHAFKSLEKKIAKLLGV